MEISNPQTLDHMITADGSVLRSIIIDLPAWNMDSVPNCAFAHGLDGTKIIAVQVHILNDPETQRQDFAASWPGNVAGVLDRIMWTDVGIYLNRKTGGYFDTVEFDDAVMSRGKALIWYID